jgi:ABC-2 type transport system ATP-binding protein
MRRRLDLGASVVSRPRVLLFDEPTTGLDPRARLELWTYLQELVAEGASLLLTTQHMEEADYLADDIAVIDHGRLIAHGSPADLKRRLGGDVLDVIVSTREALARAARALAATDGTAPEVDEGTLKVSVHVGDSAHGTARVVRQLDEAGIGIAELLVRRPSLDDVFLTLTGRPAGIDVGNGDGKPTDHGDHT